MKNKMLVSENLVQRKQMEMEQIKSKLEKKIAEEEKFTVRDKNTFEKHFGRVSRPGEEKVGFYKVK